MHIHSLQAILTHSSSPLPLRIFSYYITLFPTLDTISAFPLVNHVWVNNFYILFTGRDTALPPKYRLDWVFRITLRVVLASFPILAAFGVANLVYILKFGGLITFTVLLFPIILQIRSIHVCKNVFRNMPSHSCSEETDSKEIKQDDAINSGDDSIPPKECKSSLKSKIMRLWEEGQPSLYMTPYSGHYSHPWCAWLIGGVLCLLFILIVAGLFVHPKRVTCMVD